jgi:hypothetical protein
VQEAGPLSGGETEDLSILLLNPVYGVLPWKRFTDGSPQRDKLNLQEKLET